MKEELQKQIDELSEQIEKLEENKLTLQKQLIDLEDNFVKKFNIWVESGLGEEYSYIPSSPKLREILCEMDLNRYQTYDICELLSDEIYYATECEDRQDVIEHFDSEYCPCTKEDVLIIMKEMMDNNVISFKYDW